MHVSYICSIDNNYNYKTFMMCQPQTRIKTIYLINITCHHYLLCTTTEYDSRAEFMYSLRVVAQWCELAAEAGESFHNEAVLKMLQVLLL